MFLEAQDRHPVSFAPSGPPRRVALKMAATEQGRAQLRNESGILERLALVPEGACAVPAVELAYTEVELPDGGGLVGALIMEAGLRTVEQHVAMLVAAGDQAGPGTAALMRGVKASADALQACAVLHADLKPANMVVMPGGGVKVIDFGGAQGLGDAVGLAPARWQVDRVGSFTPGYNQPVMAMEARHGPGLVGLDFDRWGLLVTMLDILRMPPHGGIAPGATQAQVDQRLWDYERALVRMVDSRTLGEAVRRTLCGRGCADADAASIGRYMDYIASLT